MNAGILTSLIGLGINNMQDRINQERLQTVNQAFNLSTKTMPLNRGYFGPGGEVIDPESDYVVSQMDKGERFVTPTLKIYKSKSKKMHEDMEDDEVTDIIKSGSFAFSERKFFTPDDYDDDVLGYGVAHYEEDEDFELEAVNLAQVFKDPNKEISFSDGVGEIEKYYKTKDDNNKNIDIFDKITNQENIQARAPYVLKLMEIHKGDTSAKSPIIPQKFGYGGQVKKYKNGQDIYGDEVVQNMYDDELERLDSLDEMNDQMFLLGGIQGAQSTIGNRINNTAGLLVDTIGTSLQNTRVDPDLMDTSLASGMFEEVSNATADQLANTGFGRANSLISNVAARNPELARRLGPSLLGSAVENSNRVRGSIAMDNLAQRRGRYSFLNNASNFNRAQRNKAEAATNDLINRKVSGLATAANRFLTNDSAISANALDFMRGNMAQFNRNNIATGNMRRSLLGDRMNYEVQRQGQRAFSDRFDRMMSQNQSQSFVAPTPDGLNDIYGIYDYMPPAGVDYSNLG